jgi:hypothetical protein
LYIILIGSIADSPCLRQPKDTGLRGHHPIGMMVRPALVLERQKEEAVAEGKRRRRW